MFGRKMHQKLGLDIGSANIKWISYGKERKNPVIYDWGVIPTPNGAIRDGRIVALGSLKDRIEGGLDDTVQFNQGVITLSCPEMIVRTIELPKMDYKEMDILVEHEAQQFLPINSENYVTDYWVIEEIESQETGVLRVLFVGVPASIVQSYIQLLEAMNIKPQAIDFHGNSVCRFLNRFIPSIDDEVCGVIDIGASDTTITISEKGIPLFKRIINTGGDEITRVIANSFNLSLEEGEKYKRNIDQVVAEEEVEDELVREMSMSMMPIINSLLNEIYRSLDFYQNRGNKTVNSLVFAGGGSCLKGISKYLSMNLDIPITDYSTTFPVKIKKEMSQEEIALFSNVLGLAFREER